MAYVLVFKQATQNVVQTVFRAAVLNTCKLHLAQYFLNKFTTLHLKKKYISYTIVDQCLKLLIGLAYLYFHEVEYALLNLLSLVIVKTQI